MAQVLADAHVVALPSYREGLPKVLVEAAACGRPVVTTDVPGCRDAIVPGVTGLLVPPRDAVGSVGRDGAADRTTPACGSSHGPGRQGSWRRRDFGIGHIVEQHLSLYRQLLGAR